MNRTALERLLDRGEDNALLRYTLGSLCLREKAFQAAAEHLQRALQLDERHSASWKLYARALTGLGRTKEAIDVYSKGIAVAESKGDVQAAKEMRVFRRRLG